MEISLSQQELHGVLGIKPAAKMGAKNAYLYLALDSFGKTNLQLTIK